MVVIREPKTFYFDLDIPRDLDKNLKHEIEFIIKRNESLAGYEIKMKLNNYCSNISIKTIFMNTENRKTSEPQNFFLTLSQRLYLRNSNKFVVLETFLFISPGKI